MPLRIAISIGDYNGIGPEVVLKTLADTDLKDITPVILGNRRVVEFYSEVLSIAEPASFNYIGDSDTIADGSVNVLDCYDEEHVDINPGKLDKMSGKCAMEAIAKGIDLCLAKQTQALVTAPISKEAIRKAGYQVPGHTEFLAEKTDTEQVLMVLVNKGLRVALVSIHVPLVKVPSLISQASVYNRIATFAKSLERDFNIDDPKIAVMGLNPHAGDGGIIGSEEIEIIEPVIRRVQDEGVTVTGPHPADGFFGNRKYESYDGILAMYHDQGLVPFKTLSFGAGVNFTAGLPIVRTSPDHGTAFDIAGKNLADPSSFQQALSLAADLSRNRKQKGEDDG